MFYLIVKLKYVKVKVLKLDADHFLIIPYYFILWGTNNIKYNTSKI